VQSRRLALFALAASSRSIGLSRDKLIAYFWPEEERDRARHFLADSLFTIRKSLGRDLIIASGADIRLNPELICTDLWKFEDACSGRDFESAAALYRGPFLDGFYVSDAPEFERWADTERIRLGKQYGSCLERCAEQLENAGDYGAAADWWTRLSLHEPYSSRITVRTMLALEKAGDAVAAVQHAARYERLVRIDLDLPPDPGVARLAEQLRSRTAAESHAKQLVLPPRSQSSPTRDVKPVDTVTSVATRVLPQESFDRQQRTLSHRMIAAALLIIPLLTLAVGVRANSRISDDSVGTGRSAAEKSSASLSTTDEKTVLSKRQEAEQLYHEGRLVMSSAPMAERFDDAMSLFRRAVAVEPSYAPAYAAMAAAYSYKGDYAHAKEAALKAISLDSRLPEAHTVLAYVLAYYEHHWHAADSELVRVIQSSPRFAEAMLTRAYIQAVMDQSDSAVALAERAQSLEPDSWIALFNRAMIESAAGRPAEAISHFEAALNIQPDRPDVKLHLAMEYRTVGQTQAAAAILKTLHEYSYVAAIARGDPAEMRSLIHQYESDSVKMNPSTAARLYALLGEKDAVFRELRKAFWSDRYVPLFLRHQPLASLRNDPRYARLVRDLGMKNDAEAIPRPVKE
jgi:DNA-binding SARP family transcriptional activator